MMKEQEIREKITHLISYYAATPFMGANKILDLIKGAGYVQLAEDQRPPAITESGFTDSAMIRAFRCGFASALWKSAEESWRKVKVEYCQRSK